MNLPLLNLKQMDKRIYGQELGFLCSAHCLIMLYICMKFHDNILNGFQVIQQTRLCDGQTDRQTDTSMAKTVGLPLTEET